MGEIEAVIETGIYVDDLDRTEAFYRDVLGLTVIGKEPGPRNLERATRTIRAAEVGTCGKSREETRRLSNWRTAWGLMRLSTSPRYTTWSSWELDRRV